jgi:hypothetical protein
MPQVSARRVAVATLGALLAAVAARVMFVLPAEYGIDPLGSGRAMGLLVLAEPEPDAVARSTLPMRADAVAFDLQPFESVEYKYRLEAGDTLVFAWRASADVVSELHAEPDEAPEGFAESYIKSRSGHGAGGYRAGFSGWHGWFWENRGFGPVTVSLDASGFFTAARTYRGGHVWEQPLDGE